MEAIVGSRLKRFGLSSFDKITKLLSEKDNFFKQCCCFGVIKHLLPFLIGEHPELSPREGFFPSDYNLMKTVPIRKTILDVRLQKMQ